MLNLIDILNKINLEQYYSTNFSLNLYQKIPSIFIKLKNRCIINYGTGSGKTITMILMFIETLIDIYKINKNISYPKKIHIVGNFTTKDSLKSDISIPIFSLQINQLISSDIVERFTKHHNEQQVPSFSKNVMKYLNVYGYQALFNELFIGNTAHIDKSKESIELLIQQGKLKLNMKFLEELRNSYLIVDEVQNLYSRNGVNSYGVAVEFINRFVNSYNIRLIFLSATLFNSSTSEFLYLTQLIKSDDEKVYNDSDFLFRFDNGKELLEDKFSEIVDELKDKIFYYFPENDVSWYPELYQRGNIVIETDNVYLDDVLYNGLDNLVIMGLTPKGYQKANFFDTKQLTVDIDDETVKVEKSYIMTIPAKNDHNEADYYEDGGVYKGEIMKLDKIGNYSVLFEYIMKHLLSCIGKGEKSVIYNEDISYLGINQICTLLDTNGWKRYNTKIQMNTLCWKCGRSYNICTKDPTCKFVPCNYAFIVGTQTEEEKFAIIDYYKNLDNLYGDKISVLLISRAAYAGLNIPHTNHLLITSIIANITLWKQIIGRVNRYKSHVNLPSNKRFINVQTIVVIDVDEIENTNFNKIRNNKYIDNYYKKIIAQNNINKYYNRLIEECEYSFDINDEKYENINKLFDFKFENKLVSKIVLENYINFHTTNFIILLKSIKFNNSITKEYNTLVAKNYFELLFDHLLPIEYLKQYYTQEELMILFTILVQNVSNEKIDEKIIEFTPQDLINFNNLINQKEFQVLKAADFKVSTLITENLANLYDIIYSIINMNIGHISDLERDDILTVLQEINAAYYDNDEINAEQFITNHYENQNNRDTLQEISGIYFGETIYKFNGEVIKIEKNKVASTVLYRNNIQVILSTGFENRTSWPLRVLFREVDGTNNFADKRKLSPGKNCISFSEEKIINWFGNDSFNMQKRCMLIFQRMINEQHEQGYENRWLVTPYEKIEL